MAYRTRSLATLKAKWKQGGGMRPGQMELLINELLGMILDTADEMAGTDYIADVTKDDDLVMGLAAALSFYTQVCNADNCSAADVADEEDFTPSLIIAATTAAVGDLTP